MAIFYFILLILIIVVIILRPSKVVSLITDAFYGTGWGHYYKKELNLDKRKRRLLNSYSHTIESDPLCKIDFCRTAVISLFFKIYDSIDYLPPKNELDDLFLYCIYRLKVKYVLFIPISIKELEEIQRIEKTIREDIKEKLEIELENIPKLSIKQEKILNNTDKRRWSTVFENMKINYSDAHQFYEDVKAFSFSDYSIVKKRNLYFDSHLFMVGKDNVLSLKFYLHYIEVGSDSSTFKFKNIYKVNQKKIFENESQSQKYQLTIDEFKVKKNLDKAFLQIEDLFVKKRKKVILDENEISSARKDLFGVVELLNGYLEDEVIIEKKEAVIVEKEADLVSNNIGLNDVQIEFLNMFVDASYLLSFDQVNAFANSKGVFKSQLIDSINELCYDILDDMLIDENGDRYELNKKYYKKIIN